MIEYRPVLFFLGILLSGLAAAMIVPADVPLITPEEVDALITDHRRVTVVPDDQKHWTRVALDRMLSIQ